MSKSAPTSSSSSTPTSSSSSAAATPSGCDAGDFRGTGYSGTISGGFSGCVVGVASVLQSCCAEVGSTPAFVNNTCGCPYNAVFLPADEPTWAECTIHQNATSLCSLETPSAAVGRPVRWNAAVVVLSVALLLGGVEI
ncbi:hypothetical protein C8R44DRAFT_760550 [Mycena epipterygia]|nr:hypothetical protein C8R44DRAFT_760550 [Mycena epipterygia]